VTDIAVGIAQYFEVNEHDVREANVGTDAVDITLSQDLRTRNCLQLKQLQFKGDNSVQSGTS